MKTLPTLLTLCCSLFFAGACAQESGPQEPTLAMLSNGPDLPEECNQCWDEFQECFANGESAEECAGRIVECIDACQAPPPPPECLHCAAGFEACAQTAEGANDTAQDCAIGFEGCLSSCEGQSACDADPMGCDDPTDPPSDNCDGCEERYQHCVDEGWENGMDPAMENENCDHVWEECLQSCQDPTDPPGNDDCELFQQYCQMDDNGGEQGPGGLTCEELAERCENGGPGDPMDPNQCGECEQAREQCATDEPDNNCDEVEQFCSSINC